MSTQRLQKILAQSGVASRRAAEQLILDGRVRVNGRIIRELGTRANLDRDRVEVNGRRLVAERPVYYLLHKPRGVVTTLDDPEGRQTVKDLLHNVPERVFPVGRLDFHTSGVLLLTNDGALAQALLHPKRAVPKTYTAKMQGQLDIAQLDQLRAGVVLDDGEKTAPAEVCLVRSDGKHTAIEITIAEGKNRQIHRMGEAIGCPVLRLTRVSFAGLTLERLQVGKMRPLTPRELGELKQQYLHDDARPRGRGVPFSARTDIPDIQVAHPTLPHRSAREPRGRFGRPDAVATVDASSTREASAGAEPRRRTAGAFGKSRRMQSAAEAPRRSGPQRGQPRHGVDAGADSRRSGPQREQPRRAYDASADPRRSSSSTPRRTFDASADPRRSGPQRGQPRRTFDASADPKRSSSTPRRTFDASADPRRSSSAPRRGFDASREPQRSGPPRRGFDASADPRRSSTSTPRRTFDEGADPRRSGPQRGQPRRALDASPDPRRSGPARGQREQPQRAFDASADPRRATKTAPRPQHTAGPSEEPRRAFKGAKPSPRKGPVRGSGPSADPRRAAKSVARPQRTADASEAPRRTFNAGKNSPRKNAARVVSSRKHSK